jgi:hypothetical protein
MRHAHTRSRSFVVAAAAATVMGVMAGCGGGSATSAGSPAPATPSASPTSSGTPSGSASVSAAPSQKAVPAENNPPGDIPDSVAFIRYADPAAHYSFTHPEGWARTRAGGRVQFTDKLNGVRVEAVALTSPPTVASAKSSEVPRIRQTVPAFQLRSITQVRLPSGSGVKIVYRRNSDADPVTGKVYRDEVEEYLVSGQGRGVRMELFGPVGADNVDAYRTMSQSLKLR